jgi:hypothetical protein
VSDFDDIFGELFGTAKEIFGPQSIVAENGQRCESIAGAEAQKLQQRGTGYTAIGGMSATITRADFVRLAIVDRALVTVNGRKMKVMEIDDQPGHSLIGLQLVPEHHRSS